MAHRPTAGPAPGSARRLPTAVAVVLLGLLSPLLGPPGASASTAGGVGGRVFEDADRDGVHDAGEPAWPDQGIAVYDADGSYVDGSMSGTDGTWEITGLADGVYRVEMGYLSWKAVRDEWVPTTTDTVFPRGTVDVTADTRAAFDLGWRPIAWSTTLSEPLSTATGSDGLVVEAFNDAMDASSVLAALDRGTLRGDEAALTTVRFAYSDSTYCATSVGGSPGSYSGFTAACYVSYGAWLAHEDRNLFHEYGHAWSEYHRTIVHQWADLDPYLEARGIDPNDDRLYSSHAWTPGEMIAEDYRQLFDSPIAAVHPQENADIPPPDDVPSLAEWLSGTFTTGGTGDGGTNDDGSTDDGGSTEDDTTDSTSSPGAEITAVDSEAVNHGGDWTAWVDVTVTDGGTAASGVQVAADWTGEGKHGASGNASCTSDASGRCRLSVTQPKRVPSVTVDVTDPTVLTVTVAKP